MSDTPDDRNYATSLEAELDCLLRYNSMVADDVSPREVALAEYLESCVAQFNYRHPRSTQSVVEETPDV
jgi:hypothetical protein